MTTDTRGYYKKFEVRRLDGRPDRTDSEYFVLDLTHDKFAKAAALAYADACAEAIPNLALDLRAKLK